MGWIALFVALLVLVLVVKLRRVLLWLAVSVALGVGIPGLVLTVVYVVLFVSLWPYKQWVALSLLALLVLVVLVSLGGRLNEQHLRRVRIHHQEEIPLDGWGEPHYWPVGAQENPSHLLPRAAHSLHELHEPYEGPY